jgi:hypothetical protein
MGSDIKADTAILRFTRKTSRLFLNTNQYRCAASIKYRIFTAFQTVVPTRRLSTPLTVSFAQSIVLSPTP